MVMLRQKVLVADSDVECAASVQHHLEKDGYRVFVARDGSEALNMVRHRRPDILLLERSLLERHSLDLDSILQGRAETPIIVLTAKTTGEDGTFDTESRVSDQVVKPVDPCEVLCRVRAALRRAGAAVPQGPEEVCCADLVIDRRCHEVRVGNEAVHLTPTEFKLLEVLAGDPGRAFTRLELLGRVFGYDYEGLERTIDTHVKNLRSKIEPSPTNPIYVKTVYGVGYRFAGD
jgi:two-component system alkaline phosphatase synthesis response regulator PhoP